MLDNLKKVALVLWVVPWWFVGTLARCIFVVSVYMATFDKHWVKKYWKNTY